MSKKNGFTLIELLAVMAIVSIIAAIMLPVFTQVREQTRRTTCLSNERQIALACQLYTISNEGAFPVWSDATNKCDGQDWQQNYGVNIYSIPDIDSLLSPFVPNKEVFYCPDEIGVSSDDNGKNCSISIEDWNTSGSSYLSNTWGQMQCMFANGLPESQTVVLFDHGSFHSSRNSVYGPRVYNAGFADGHVAFMTRSRLEYFESLLPPPTNG